MSNFPSIFEDGEMPDFTTENGFDPTPASAPAPAPMPLPTPEPAPKYVHPVVAEVRALLDEYGDFVRGKKKAREILDRLGDGYPRYEDISTLRTTIRATKLELKAMEAFVPEEPVDWPEHHVEHAIRVLTALDQDRTAEANGVGWGRGTTSIGHYVHALLVRGDRDRAIEIGRGIVGGHKLQLEKKKVRGMYPLPADWIRGAAK